MSMAVRTAQNVLSIPTLAQRALWPCGVARAGRSWFVVRCVGGVSKAVDSVLLDTQSPFVVSSPVGYVDLYPVRYRRRQAWSMSWCTVHLVRDKRCVTTSVFVDRSIFARRLL